MDWLVMTTALGLLILGADLLVRGAARLAARFGVSALVVGLTVVAFGTSAPELAVSVKSAWSGQTELAIANVVGSNIFNVLFILGLAALISPLMVSRQLIRQDVPIMVLASLVAFVMTSDGAIGTFEATFLFGGLVGYTAFLFVQGRKGGAEAAAGEANALLEKRKPLWDKVAMVAGGLALLVVGARWLVNSAVEIASDLGVSEAVIGLTIVAAGTSLPEVVTSVVAALKGQRDIAIGNVVGSNTFNILCVLGVSGLVSPLPLLTGAGLGQIDLPVMLGVTVLCLPLFFTGARLARFEGLLFLVLYIAYVGYRVAVATSHPYASTLGTAILYGLVPAVICCTLWALVRDLHQRRIR